MSKNLSDDPSPADPVEAAKPAGSGISRPAWPVAARGWQFSLRTLLVGTTAFATLCGLVVILPTAFSDLILGAFWIVVSGWLITGILFAKGDKRAFCLGAAVVATSMWTGLGGRFVAGIRSLLQVIPWHWFAGPFSDTQSLEVWLIHLVLVVAAIANGWLCIRARRHFEDSTAD